VANLEIEVMCLRIYHAITGDRQHKTRTCHFYYLILCVLFKPTTFNFQLNVRPFSEMKIPQRLSITILAAFISVQCQAFANRGARFCVSERNNFARRPTNSRLLSDLTSDDSQENTSNNDGIDLSSNPNLYEVRLPRALGIEWGTDLSFSFVYVRAIEPGSAADYSGVVSVGDQICQIRTVPTGENQETPEPLNVVGAPFDNVMGIFAGIDNKVKEVDLMFFRGTKDELIAACKENDSSSTSNTENDEMITITVIEKGENSSKMTKRIRAAKGANVRQCLTDEGINVYQSFTRWTNCKGKQLCGTCIVDISEGSINTNRKSMDEASTLRENPESYRLSCVTFAYGDITVETFPPIGKAQWTR